MRHADAGVAYLEAQLDAVFAAANAVDRQGDFALFGEFERIADQVEQYLVQAQGIAAQIVGDFRSDVEEQLDAAFARLGLTDIGDVLQIVVEAECGVFDLHFSGLDFRDVENVVDDAEQPLGCIIDLAQVVFLTGREVGLQCQMRHADDGIHRRADFMTHVGKEVGLGCCGFFCCGTGAFGFALGIFQGRDIDDDADQPARLALGGAKTGDRVEGIAECAVGSLHRNFARDAAAFGNDHLVFGLIGETCIFRKIFEVEDAFTDEVGTVDAEKCLISVIAAEEMGMRSLVENWVGYGVEQGLQEGKLANQLGFHLTPVGDIEDGDQQGVEFAAFIADGGNLHVAPASVSAASHEFEFAAHELVLSGGKFAQCGLQALLFGRWQDSCFRLGEQGFDRVAGELGKSPVNQCPFALRIETDNADGGVVEYRPEEAFALLQAGLAFA